MVRIVGSGAKNAKGYTITGDDDLCWESFSHYYMLLFLYKYCLSIRQGYRTITFLWKFHHRLYTRYSILPLWNFEFSVNDLSSKQAQRAENCVNVTEFKQLFQFLDSLLFLFKPNFQFLDSLLFLFKPNFHLARCSFFCTRKMKQNACITEWPQQIYIEA